SGAEATEAAIKLIHKWTSRSQNGREGIAVLKNSFHGRTLGALRLTRQAHVYQDFPQPVFPVYEMEANDQEELRRVCEEQRPAAVLLEPVLGSGGVIPLDESYLQAVAEICKQEGILLCMDEIQTGMGRTGTFFAYQHADITPDLILFAKGVGGGLPLGGVIAGEVLMNLFAPGDHGTTFAPSPLSAALGNAVVKTVMDEGFKQQVHETIDYLWNRLSALRAQYPDAVKEIRGKGMMVGILLDAPAERISQLQRKLLEQGILVDVTQKTIVRLLPPLTLTKAEIDRFIDTFSQAIARIG
ncbi:aminotransferase class III-fold pyridoxal phosphate-dependent enzyme, partial [Frankia sp. Cpl3]|nr:aminotransferase class III-fold pyridoxal phosphate-dependent enzyme [Frankia sp. Cpl3]